MKTLNSPVKQTLFACLIFLPICIFSQNNSVQEVVKVFQNWDYFHERKQFDKAIDQAELAFKFAERINRKDLMSGALYRKGLSHLLIPKRVSKNRKIAKEKFTESLLLATASSATQLRLDNLTQLKRIAAIEKDLEKETYYEKQINDLKALVFTKVENETLSENNEKLAVNNEQLESNNDLLEEKTVQLNTQRVRLSNKVKSLTEAQLESQLLIALTNHQVDSLNFERTRDSFLLEAKELILSSQNSKLELQNSHIELQNSQIQLQSSQRNFWLALAGIIALLGIGAMMRYMETKKYNLELETKSKLIEEQIKRSDELLLNILPVMVAKELKENGVAKARKYDQATVLFADFKNFSAIAEKLSPEELVKELDFYFKTFDKIILKHGLEKIKTIGDAYMCVGGLPEKKSSHVEDIIKAALEIQMTLIKLKKERAKKGEPFFEARIGIHTGPLIAGVVGSSKFAYDVWGDTVNVAARLESTSEAGKVNISASTFEMVKEEFDCEYRGKIPVKNKGEIEMYFVNGVN